MTSMDKIVVRNITGNLDISFSFLCFWRGLCWPGISCNKMTSKFLRLYRMKLFLCMFIFSYDMEACSCYFCCFWLIHKFLFHFFYDKHKWV